METPKSLLLLTISSLFLLTPSLTATTSSPACANIEKQCALGLCTEVPILLPPEHTAINLTCVNNDLSAVTIPHSYWLTGCPTTYFNTLQSGVCMITTNNTTDLFVTPNELPSGLHSFDCLYNESPTGMVSTRFIVVNRRAPYRDFLMYINGALQDHYSSVNVTLQVGDNFTVVVRAIGNVTRITHKSDDLPFICETGFACNRHSHINSRYLKCSLHSPAELSDNKRTLTILVDNVELERFIITVNNPSTTETTNATVTLLPTSPSKEGLPSGGSGDSSFAVGRTIITFVILIIIALAV